MINSQSQSLWPHIEPLLPRVEKPSRYIGSEYCTSSARAQAASGNTGGGADCPSNNWAGLDGGGSPVIDAHPRGQLTTPVPSSEHLDVALIYPDIYDIGASNQALVILYDLACRLPGVGAERAFLPWLDMAAVLRERELPLCSLESARPLKDFDLLGITLPHELVATNLCELFDLAHIPLLATGRGEDLPLVIGGGPVANNPAPLSGFFDAFCIGEGEEAFADALMALARAKRLNKSRPERLRILADLPGFYVPSIKQDKVQRQIVQAFANYPVVIDPILPFVDVSQDRFSVEIFRGCTRGCRFCAAGMVGRPVRERSADVIVQAVTQGLATTGLSEASLNSLSSTDHSQIAQVLRRLAHRYLGSDTKISLPSQRMDSFGVSMAALVCGSQKKGSLTFAPEAGTQRLRDVINKNITEDDILGAICAAYEAGWRRTKLYFMLGLPTETDEDIEAIVELANKAYNAAKDAVEDNERAKVRMSISAAVFVPKAHTPFQFCGQVPQEELNRRVHLLKSARLHKGIDLHWHDPSSSMIEAVFSRGDASLTALGIQAWKLGARFDAWSEQFDLAIWEEAASALGMDLASLAERSLGLEEPLPWDFITGGVSKEFLVREYQHSLAAVLTPDCTRATCGSCGVCNDDVLTEVVAYRG